MQQNVPTNALPQSAKRSETGPAAVRPFAAQPRSSAERSGSAQAASTPSSDGQAVEDGWFAGLDGKAVGPLPARDVRQRIHSGEMNPETLVWREGMAGWQPLARVPSLAPMVAPAEAAFGSLQNDGLDDDLDDGATAIWHQDDVSGGSLAAQSHDAASHDPAHLGVGVDRDERGESNLANRSAGWADPRGSVAPLRETSIQPDGSEDEELPSSSMYRRRQSMGAAAEDPLVGTANISPHAFNYREPSREEALVSLPPIAESRRRRLPVWAFALIAAAMAFGMSLGILLGLRWIFPQSMTATQAIEPEVIPEPSVQDEPDDLYIPPEVESEGTAEKPAAVQRERATGGSARPEPRRTRERPEDAQEDGLSAADKAKLARMAGGGVKGAGSNAFGGSAGKASSGQSLTNAQLSKVVNDNRPALKRCHEKALRGRPSTPRMRVDFLVNVGTSGVVTKVEVSGSTIAEMTTCMTQTIKRWRFPAATSPSSVKFPVVFDPGA